MRPGITVLSLIMMLCALVPDQASAQNGAVTSVHVNGVDLAYVERGRGEPLILLHGGQGDYRSWEPQLSMLSERFRVIAYSRRFNYPNDNPITVDYRSAFTDADDLAAIIRHLNLGPVHLVGTSAGALAALVLATDRPEMVRSLVLAEPPIHSWARSDPRGRVLYQDFMDTIWIPAGDAFRSNREDDAMRILVDGFGGKGRFDALAPANRTVAMQNARFFKAATQSADPFPEISKDRVRRLTMPVLIVTGENTVPLHNFVNNMLAAVLPRASRVTIPGAGHGSARENPSAFNAAVIRFLATVSK